MKVLHLPTSVGGNSWGLSQGERMLGLDSEVLYLNDNWLNYPCDINLKFEKIDNKFKQIIKLITTFLGIRNKYDIFHFNFGTSLINYEKYGLLNAELPLYPKNKKLFVTYNGCDARQKFPTIKRAAITACHHAACNSGICNSGKIDKIRRLKIKKMAKYVRHIWAVNPDLLYFLPKEKSSFIPYTVTIESNSPIINNFDKKKVKIVHAPTDRVIKGSEIIIATLEKIKKIYPQYIDVCLIENVPHNKAINIYKEADIIIDQILIGWYGGLAIEVMNFGKPVICRIEKKDLQFIPPKMANDVLDAFIQADPNTLEDTIINCIENRKFLKNISEAAVEYARKWHDPKYVASITKEAYEN